MHTSSFTYEHDIEIHISHYFAFGKRDLEKTEKEKEKNKNVCYLTKRLANKEMIACLLNSNEY